MASGALRKCFAEGSERGPYFFDVTLPEELVGVIHPADFEILITAVNRMREQLTSDQTSRCRMFTRWLSRIDEKTVIEAGREAIAQFLEEENTRWCVSDAWVCGVFGCRRPR